MAQERRQDRRRRTRLRPAKLLTGGGRFLCDCAMIDRSTSGVRVRCFQSVDLPDELFLVDEVEAVKWRVAAAWQAGSEAGLRLDPVAGRLDAEEYRRVAGRYYAVAG